MFPSVFPYVYCVIRIRDTSFPPFDDPFIFRLVVDHRCVVSSVYAQDVGCRYIIIIYRFYVRL